MKCNVRNVSQISKFGALPLYSSAGTRALEAHLQTMLPEHSLMQRAGLACAELALAIAPHARKIWIACGPGNNGGDGLEAAVHLKQWGKDVTATWLGNPQDSPKHALSSWQRAKMAGVVIHSKPPESFDLSIDALLGLGCSRPPEGPMAQWLQTMHASGKPVLAIDLPTGLNADTGTWFRPANTLTSFSPVHTLSLLTLKPGLFTADGRDACGQVWFDDLGSSSVEQDWQQVIPSAYLQSPYAKNLIPRRHNSHKGTYGELMVIGGAPGMAGAAILASVAALHSGAGRVYACLLDTTFGSNATAQYPALMVRDVNSLQLEKASIVCGCGGGDEVRAILPKILSASAQLVLDADALNAISSDSSLFHLLKGRTRTGRSTVLTPHPLEAARLLKCTAQDIQNNRLQAAQQLAGLTGAVVVLKGSGTVIATDQTTPVINPTGNARLASAGTGDVLAGVIGAKMAQGLSAFDAACDGVRAHGFAADAWPDSGPALDAASLATCIGTQH